MPDMYLILEPYGNPKRILALIISALEIPMRDLNLPLLRASLVCTGHVRMLHGHVDVHCMVIGWLIHLTVVFSPSEGLIQI